MQNDDTRKTIKTISKAASVLKAVSLGTNSLSAIARTVGLSKNGVYRMLYSLKQEGFVVQDPIKRTYYPGPTLFELSGNPLIMHQYLINCSYLDLEDLRQTTGETVILDIKFGMEKIILRQLIGTHNVTFVGKPNPVEHLWIGAAGKVLMSQLDEHELEMTLDNVILAATTPYSITDMQVFRQEVAKAKENGYATSFSEVELGLANIAVPVKGYIVPASLGIVGPDNRLIPHTADLVTRLKKTSEKITQSLAR